VNRVKKELIKRGVQINVEPYFIKGKSVFEPGNIQFQGVAVNTDTAEFTTFYNVIAERYKLLRNGEIVEITEDHDNPPFA